MANILSINPWSLDTVGLVPQYTDIVRIEDISWQGATTIGHQLLITDRNGNLIWSATCSGVGQQNRGKLFWVNGFWLKTLDSGVVIVTIN
jgi:hypothetical protein